MSLNETFSADNILEQTNQVYMSVNQTYFACFTVRSFCSGFEESSSLCTLTSDPVELDQYTSDNN